MSNDGIARHELARITIVRRLWEDGYDTFTVEAVSPDGDELALIESLGLLELAKMELLAPAILATSEREE